MHGLFGVSCKFKKREIDKIQEELRRRLQLDEDIFEAEPELSGRYKATQLPLGLAHRLQMALFNMGYSPTRFRETQPKR